MDSSNVPIGAVQKILGYEKRTTTEIHLHSIGDMERLAIATYEQARQKSHSNGKWVAAYTLQPTITFPK